MPVTKTKRSGSAGAVSGRLRELLRGLNLSGYAIARAADVDPKNVRNFLAGRNKLSGESIDRVCEAYGFALVDTRAARKTRAARPAAAEILGNPGKGVDTLEQGCILPRDEGE